MSRAVFRSVIGHLDNIRKHLSTPRVLALCVFAAGLIGLPGHLYISNPYISLYPPLLVIAAGLYFSLPKNLNVIKTIRASSWLSPRVIGIVYVWITIGLILSFHAAGQTRGLLVYMFTIGLYLVTGLALLMCQPRISFALVILTGLLHRITMMFAGPQQFGNDGLFHTRIAETIAAEGTRQALSDAGSHYYDVPLYHLLLATMLKFGTSARFAAFLVTTVPYTFISSLVVYLVGTHLYSRRLAVIAAWLFVASDYALGWSVRATTTSFGVSFFALIILLAVTALWSTSLRRHALLLVVFVALTLSHHITAFVALVALGALGLGVLLYYSPRVSNQLGASQLLAMSSVNSAVVLGGVWLYARIGGMNPPNITFLEQAGMTITVRLLGASLFAHPSNFVPADLTVGGAGALTLVHTIGGALLMFSAIFGWLWYLHQYRNTTRTRVVFALGVGLGTLYAITFGGPVVGIRYLQPMRFFQFNYLLAAILAPLGVLTLITVGGRLRLNSRLVRSTLILVLVSYTALMGGTFIGALDDPIFDSAPNAQRYQMSEREHALYRMSTRLTQRSSTTVVGDHLATVVVNRHYHGDSEVIDYDYAEARLRYQQPVIVMERPYLFEHHAAYDVHVDGREIGVVMPLPKDAVSCPYAETVYSSSGNHQLTRLPQACLN